MNNEINVYKKDFHDALKESPKGIKILIKVHGNQHYQSLMKKLSSKLGSFSPPFEQETDQGLLLVFPNSEMIFSVISDYREYVKELQESKGIFKEYFAEFV